MGGHATFAGVDVGLASKVRGSEAEEEWQEVDWVTWSTGEVTVDKASFLLSFKPTGVAGTVKAKSLGSLIRASAVDQAEGGRTLIVTTSDALHRLYRFTFPSARQAGDFSRLAESAEAAQAASSSVGDARAEPCALAAAAAKLEAEIREALIGRWPLVYSGAELFGPDPGGEGGSEVLLGRGAVVLLDPSDTAGRVGSYEVLFYGEEEGAEEPIKRFTIGPKMSLKRQQSQAEDEEGPQASFELSAPLQGVPAHTLTFDSDSTGAGFSRDFRVRQRLMEVSLKNVKRERTADDLRNELQGMRQQSMIMRLFRLVRIVFLLALLWAIVRVGSLYAKDDGKQDLPAYIGVLAKDASAVVAWSRAGSKRLGMQACELMMGSSVPLDAVQKCADARTWSKSSSCLAELLQTSRL